MLIFYGLPIRCCAHNIWPHSKHPSRSAFKQYSDNHQQCLRKLFNAVFFLISFRRYSSNKINTNTFQMFCESYTIIVLHRDDPSSHCYFWIRLFIIFRLQWNTKFAFGKYVKESRGKMHFIKHFRKRTITNTFNNNNNKIVVYFHIQIDMRQVRKKKYLQGVRKRLENLNISELTQTYLSC